MEKTRAVRVMRERHGYRLARLFAAVGLARATYHRLAPRLDAPSRVDLATPLVHEAFERLGRVAGYRRVHRLMRARMRVGERLVRMIMRRDGLVPLYMGKAPRAYSSYRGCPYRFVKSYQLDCVSFLGHVSPCRWRLAVQAVRCMGW